MLLYNFDFVSINHYLILGKQRFIDRKRHKCLGCLNIDIWPIFCPYFYSIRYKISPEKYLPVTLAGQRQTEQRIDRYGQHSLEIEHRYQG